MIRSSVLRKIITLVTSVTAAATVLAPIAMSQPALPPKARADSAKTPAALFTKKDYLIGGAFVVGTFAMFPFDERLARHLTNPGAQANTFFKNASKGVEWIASPGAYIIGGSLYAVGRIGHFERVADLGWHGTEAVFVADAATYLLKGLTGRARPFFAGDSLPNDFKFAKGFNDSNRQSFPSGHATSAFAAAAAVTAETGTWWPKSTWVIGPLMYGGATLVGLSRMYHNKHWASDVVLGAAIGTFSGQKIVQYSHAHPTRLDKIMLHVSALPDGNGGWALAWSGTLP
ncbi:MAG TPA: phosphatase PAP2 family protein [Gemmatimonadaceae bacterium]|nr:phosphatase PAP2 family protein [Gemmatimonadaceae bacterium]